MDLDSSYKDKNGLFLFSIILSLFSLLQILILLFLFCRNVQHARTQNRIRFQEMKKKKKQQRLV